MAAHPVIRSLVKKIGVLFVAENVQEKGPVRAKPAGDPLQEQPPVAHVLEHLHADDPVEPATRLKVIHVRALGPQVGQAGLTGRGGDEVDLVLGVGDRGDPGAGMPSGQPERERAPAATQFQDIHAVHKAGPIGNQSQHGLFGTGQVSGHAFLFRKKTAAVLHGRTEHQPEKVRRNLVMLVIGRLRNQGHGRGIHGPDQGPFPLQVRGGIRTKMPPQHLGMALTNAQADQGIRQAAVFGQGDKVMHFSSIHR